MIQGDLGLHSALRADIIRAHPNLPAHLRSMLHLGQGDSGVALAAFRAAPHLPSELAHELLDQVLSRVSVGTALHGKVVRADGKHEELGLLSAHGPFEPGKLVTAGGVKWLTDNLAGSVATIANLKQHRLGTGTTITGNTVANPTVITTSTAHGLTTGQSVTITGSNSTPVINGTYTATVTDATHFTVPVNVTGAGTTGQVIGAATVTDTGLENETTSTVVTGYPVAGTQVSAASGNNATYTSVATSTVATGQSLNLLEYMIAWAASGANVCFDRFTFLVVSLAAADSFQSTFTLTASSGG